MDAHLRLHSPRQAAGRTADLDQCPAAGGNGAAVTDGRDQRRQGLDAAHGVGVSVQEAQTPNDPGLRRSGRRADPGDAGDGPQPDPASARQRPRGHAAAAARGGPESWVLWR